VHKYKVTQKEPLHSFLYVGKMLIIFKMISLSGSAVNLATKMPGKIPLHVKLVGPLPHEICGTFLISSDWCWWPGIVAPLSLDRHRCKIVMSQQVKQRRTA